MAMKEWLGLFSLLASSVALADVAPDVGTKVATLPTPYPVSWVFVHESNPHNGMIGQTLIVDAGSPSRNLRGSIQSSLLGNFAEARSRNELYESETVFSRGTYGKRTDLVVIYDKASLEPVGEIVLPGGKRALLLPRKAMFTLTGDDRFGLVYNFTPAASVTVVDLVKRARVGEIQLPGCSMLYPMAERSFITLCAGGSLDAITLNSKGGAASESLSRPFNDIDKDPLFMDSAYIQGARYFVSFHGQVQPITLNGHSGEVGEKWPLLDAADSKESWRPSGFQPLTSDTAGRLYVLMRKGARDGEQSAGGDEVWVYDVVAKRRVARIVLKKQAAVIEATRGEKPLLTVVNTDQDLDVYDSAGGAWVRRIGGWRNITPFSVYAAQAGHD
jgi:methylamine dehydrogenase heavy chain